METTICNHIEIVEGIPGTVQIATCTLCGQARRFKDTDEASEVITKLGWINGKIVVPRAGTRYALTPEESRWVKEGWDTIRESQDEKQFQKKLRALTKTPPLVPTPELEPGPEPEPGPGKIYYCKKCDFSNPDKRKLIGHYSSAHSWHHREPTGEAPPPTETVEKIKVKSRKQKGKYDERREDILLDYGQMTIVDLEKKWNIPTHSFPSIKRRWKAQGIEIPTAFAGRPRTGKTLECVDCGKQIYIRKYRLKKEPDAEYRCAKCARKHFMPPIKVPRSQKERRQGDRKHGILFAINGLAAQSKDLSADMDSVPKLLSKWLRLEPIATVQVLLPGHCFDPFNPEGLIKAAMELFVEAILREESRFEYLGAGLWRLKEEE